MAKNPKMRVCKNCNTEIAAKAKKCPACGARQKGPFYQRGWFIFLIIIVIFGIVSSGIRRNTEKNAEKAEKANEYRWPEETESSEGEPESQETEPFEEEPEEPGEETSAETESAEPTDGDDGGLVDGMRPEFKEAMDSYEAFYDEYCELLQEYAANPTDITLLGKYTEFLSKAAEMDEKFDAWEGDMNDTELKYYTEVGLRISQKLIETGTEMQQ